MKRGMFVLLLVLLLILVCVYFFVDYFTNLNVLVHNVDTISVYSCDTMLIKSIEVNNETDSYIFVKTEDGWNVEDANIRLVQSRVIGFTYDFDNLLCDTVVEPHMDDPAKYGFDNARARLKVTLNDGSGEEFILGGKIPGNNGYYFKVADDDTVYSILNFRAENMLRKLSYYREGSFYLISPDDFDRIVITGGERDIEIAAEGLDEDSHSLRLKRPFDREIYYMEFTDKVLKPIAGIRVYDFVEDDPGDLAKYFLDQPQYSLTVEAIQHSWTFLISEMVDDIYYFKEKDKNSIYSAPADAFEFLNMNPFDYMDRYFYLPNMSDLKEIWIKTPLDVKIGIAPNDYKINGEPVEKNDVVAIFQRLFDLKITGETDKIVYNGGYVEVEVTYNDGRVDKLSFKDIDGLDAAAFLNGETQFYLPKKDIDDALKQIEAITQK